MTYCLWLCWYSPAPNLCWFLVTLLPCVYQLTATKENSKTQISCLFLKKYIISAFCKCNWREENYFELLKIQSPYIIKVRRLIENNNPFSHTYFNFKTSHSLTLSFFLVRILLSHSLRTTTQFLKVYKGWVKWITELLYNQQWSH